MPIITVIVPFYQRESGILRRALNSILSQTIPHGWSVEVIVVDDASPSPADEEVSGLEFREPLSLKLFHQKNGGPGAARNRGLDEMDRNTTLIAFLDSDDVWPTNHLARAIEAFNSGFDFYFTDNKRNGNFSSYIKHCAPETGKFIAASDSKKGILELQSSQTLGFVIKEFPTQASTVAYKRSIASDLRFDTTLTLAGEDILFFSLLVTKASRIGFDLDSCVECGIGVNIFFSNFGWDSPKFLAIQVDQVRSHRLIDKLVALTPESRKLNKEATILRRKQLAFHIMRNLLKFPGRVPKEVMRLFRLDPGAAVLLPLDMMGVVLYRNFSPDRG